MKVTMHQKSTVTHTERSPKETGFEEINWWVCFTFRQKDTDDDIQSNMGLLLWTTRDWQRVWKTRAVLFWWVVLSTLNKQRGIASVSMHARSPEPWRKEGDDPITCWSYTYQKTKKLTSTWTWLFGWMLVESECLNWRVQLRRTLLHPLLSQLKEWVGSEQDWGIDKPAAESLIGSIRYPEEVNELRAASTATRQLFVPGYKIN